MNQMPKAQSIYYGGDYNPEQWEPDVWEEDMRLLKLAGINIVTLNVFNWAMLQPDESTYDFTALDETVRRVTDHGMNICMATSTGAHPAWMARKYPDVLRTEFNGLKRKFGGRHNSCANSRNFRNFAEALVEQLASRYQGYDNIVAWHVSNEYGGECYCENCEKAFRIWLKKRYGTLQALNQAWNTAFWGHTFYSWDDIVVPNLLSEHFAPSRTTQQGISLDYARFNSDSMLENYKAEYAVIKKYMPDVPVTTNFMGLYKPVDYQAWAPYLDFVSWDNYPTNEAPVSLSSFNHDTMRGLKGGQPFVLMEQTPSVSNWLPYCALKRPGVMRLWSYQAVAHGADAVMFFQMRRSPGSCEKFHGAVIDHAGHENTRVFRECAQLGAELQKLDHHILGSRVPAKVAILFDWNNWWAIEYSAGPNSDLRYPEEVFNYYRALNEQNIMVDIIGAEDDLSGYDLVIAPVLYMVKPGQEETLKAYVKQGGTFLTTFFSGYVDENDRITTGGYPGKLRDLLGIWVEEIDALAPDAENRFSYRGDTYPAKLLCDLLHCETAQPMCVYEQDFYAGMPVLTKNSYGKGNAYYVATRSNDKFYDTFLKQLCDELNISPVMDTPKGVEVTRREREGVSYTFVLNHSGEKQCILLPEDATELLSGAAVKANSAYMLAVNDVLILSSQSHAASR